MFLLDPYLPATLGYYTQMKTSDRWRLMRGGMRQLSGRYGYERLLYLQSNKRYAPSATFIRDELSHPILSYSNPGSRIKKLRKANKTFDQLTPKEFEAIAELAKGQGQNIEVGFFTKLDRLKYLVKVNSADGKLYNIRDELFDTGGSTIIYAMDGYGMLFAGSLDATGQQRYNHSSFLAGKQVICAGSIMVANGVLTMIDNSSGHYKPTRENLWDAIVILHDENADLTHAEVQIFEKPPNPPDPDRPFRLQIYQALNFYHNKDGAPVHPSVWLML